MSDLILPTKLYRIKPIVSSTLVMKARHQANVLANEFTREYNNCTKDSIMGKGLYPFAYVIEKPYSQKKKKYQYLYTILNMLYVFR